MDSFVEEIYSEEYEACTYDYHKEINILNQTKEQIKGWCELFNVRRTDPVPLPVFRSHRITIDEEVRGLSFATEGPDRIHINGDHNDRSIACTLNPPQLDSRARQGNYYGRKRIFHTDGEYFEDETEIRFCHRDMSAILARDENGQLKSYGRQFSRQKSSNNM